LPDRLKRVSRLGNTDEGGYVKQISEDGEVNSFVFDMVVLNGVTSYRDLQIQIL
jgi:hypothetical protein